MIPIKNETVSRIHRFYLNANGSYKICVVCLEPKDRCVYAHTKCWDSISRESQDYVISFQHYQPFIQHGFEYIDIDMDRIKREVK